MSAGLDERVLFQATKTIPDKKNGRRVKNNQGFTLFLYIITYITC